MILLLVFLLLGMSDAMPRRVEVGWHGWAGDEGRQGSKGAGGTTRRGDVAAVFVVADGRER